MEIVRQRDAATLAYYQHPHSSRYDNTFRHVGSIQKGPGITSRGSTSHSEPLSTLCGPRHWCAYSEYRKLLESGQDEAEKDERMPCTSVTRVPGWIYVAGAPWSDLPRHSHQYNAWYCTGISSVATSKAQKHHQYTFPIFLTLIQTTVPSSFYTSPQQITDPSSLYLYHHSKLLSPPSLHDILSLQQRDSRVRSVLISACAKFFDPVVQI